MRKTKIRPHLTIIIQRIKQSSGSQVPHRKGPCSAVFPVVVVVVVVVVEESHAMRF